MKWFSAWLNGGVLLCGLLGWEWWVRSMDVPVYLLPGPLAILAAFGTHGRGLMVGAVVTTGEALAGLLVGSLFGRCACEPGRHGVHGHGCGDLCHRPAAA